MTTQPAPTPIPVPLTLRQQRRANLFRWYSPKAGRTVDAESYLEFRHLLWREIDRDVVALCERPAPRVEAYVHGEWLQYTFDAWTRRRDGEELFIEVKPEAKLAEDGRPVRWPLVHAWCESQGIRCDWVTDTHLKKHQCLLDNWEQALPYVSLAERSHDTGITDDVRELVRQHHALTLSSIPGFLLKHDPERVTAGVFQLLYLGQLKADLSSKPLTPTLVIEAPQREPT